MRQYRKRIVSAGNVAAVMLLLLATGAGPSLAGQLTDAARQAEMLAAEGKAKEAFETIRKALGDFSATLPFTIGEAVFVTGKPSAYGAYTPRPDAIFKSGEPLLTYLELVGLSWKTLPDGQFQSHFTVDLDLLDKAGETLASQPNFGDFTFTGRVRNQELYTHLTLDLTGADPGDYKVRYTVTDTTTGSRAEVSLPFTISASP